MKLKINSNLRTAQIIFIECDDCYFGYYKNGVLIYNKHTDQLLGTLSQEEYEEQIKIFNKRN